MGLFDKFTGGGGGPLDMIKQQMQAAGINTSKVTVSMSGSTVVLSGTVSTAAEMSKINAFIKANPIFTVKNNLSVAGGGNKNSSNNEEESYEEDYEEGYDEDYEGEDYDFGHIDGKVAQVILEALGYELGKIDGIVGPKTKTALKSFQKDYELTVNGQLDEETKAALGEAFYNDVEELSVLAVQIILEEAGHDVGYVDGIMGPKTKLAIRNFQEENELDPTGRIDEDTLAALKEAYV